jgi:hypothetical protein
MNPVEKHEKIGKPGGRSFCSNPPKYNRSMVEQTCSKERNKMKHTRRTKDSWRSEASF